jgi:hypothetical protein
VGGLGDEHRARCRGRLQPCRQIGRIADRCVVHAQVVADVAHHHRAGVDPDPHAELEAARRVDLAAQRLDRGLHREPRHHGATRRVLERERGAEQRHHAVAGELVDDPLELVHLGEQRLHAALHPAVQILGIDALADRSEADRVGEQHRHDLALAFDRRALAKDAVCQVRRCVGERLRRRGVAGRNGRGRSGDREAAAVAEARAGTQHSPAVGASGCEGRTAAVAETRVLAILVLAAAAANDALPHRRLQRRAYHGHGRPGSCVLWIGR